MNFLAHYALIQPDGSSPGMVLGNALPDLLPLAAPRARFRPLTVAAASVGPLRDGVLTHLAADAAFHRAPAFAHAQEGMKTLLREAGFVGMRLRPFFLAHVLAELALDAALLRADPSLAESFYAAFAAADFTEAIRWTEDTLHQPFPELLGVLTRFSRSRYVTRYAEDAGVAEGLSRLCARARQDTFRGTNFAHLTETVSQAVPLLHVLAPALFLETQANLSMPARS